jgi:hypothetical protein
MPALALAVIDGGNVNNLKRENIGLKFIIGFKVTESDKKDIDVTKCGFCIYDLEYF